MIPLPEAILLASLVLAAGMILSAWIIASNLSAIKSIVLDSSSSHSVPIQAAPPLPPEAYPVEPSGILVGHDTRIEIGSALLANWNGLWWRATAIGLESDGQVRISYVGWDSSWDSTVTREELQMDISGSIKN